VSATCSGRIETDESTTNKKSVFVQPFEELPSVPESVEMVAPLPPLELAPVPPLELAPVPPLELPPLAEAPLPATALPPPSAEQAAMVAASATSPTLDASKPVLMARW
jgi:hypothetical protein